MQHEGDVVRFGIASGRGGARGLGAGVEMKASGSLLAERLQGEDRHAELFRHRDRRRFHALLHDQRAGVEVRQVEFELLGAIARIERGGGGAGGDGEKGGSHFGSVGQHDGDPVVAADPDLVEGLQGFGDLAAQGPEGERRRAGSAERHRGGVDGGQKQLNGRRKAHE